MDMTQDNMFFTNNTTDVRDNTSLNKRRRFAPSSVPLIYTTDNSAIEHQVFDSPLILELCDQAPTSAEIEAQLLQVGMRIRKSVNDGYQTIPARHAFTPRPFFNMHRLSPQTQAALCAAPAPGSQFSAGGLHNVGNMGMQPISTATFCGINLAALAHISDDWSTSVPEQKMWSYSTSSKRGYEEDSDSDESQDFLPRTPTLCPDTGMETPMDYFNIAMGSAGAISPFTQVGEQHRAQPNGRRVAMPKSRVRHAQTLAPTPAWNPFANMSLPQQQQQQQQQPQNNSWTGHKRMTSCGIEAKIAINDFADAPFLQRREDVDMDCS